MDRTDKTKPAPRSNLGGAGWLITDVHSENGLVEPLDAGSTPSLSGESQGPAPIGSSADGPLAAMERYRWLIDRILTQDYNLSSHDADDVDQDVFLAFMMGWAGRRQTDEKSTEAWVRTIVKRVVRKHRRRSERRPKTGFGPEVFESIQASGGKEPTLDELIDKESRKRMAVALDKLPEARRKAVQLRFWNDKTIPEIAVELGCSPRTVSLWLKAARQELMPLAEEDDFQC
jgi:RNA polymerase sigma factor (sigma-70 family)